MKKLILLLTFALMLVNVACKNNKQSTNNDNNQMEKPEMSIDTTLTGLLKYYYNMQENKTEDLYLTYYSRSDFDDNKPNGDINYTDLENGSNVIDVSDDEWSPYDEWLPYTDNEYMELIAPYIYEGLKKKGLELVSDSLFKVKLLEVFGINIDKLPFCTIKNPIGFEFDYAAYYTFREGYNKLLSNILKEKESGDEDYWNAIARSSDDFYFFTNSHVFTRYRPDLDLVVKIEGKQITPNILDNFVYANQYVFFGSNAARKWLMTHDKAFMGQLVRTFGYVKDKELLKWVIENTKFEWSQQADNFLAFSRVLTHRRYNGKLHFNTEVFDILNEDVENYSGEILDYLEYIMNDSDELIRDNKKKIFHNFAEQAETVARLLYWGELYSQKSGTMSHQFMGRFYDLSQDRDKYDAEFKRCNYYGLDNFRELWEQAKIDRQGETNN